MIILSPSFELLGELVDVDIKAPMEMHPRPSALVCIRFGPERLWNNESETNFVNDIYVKMPFNTYSKRIEKFTRGAMLRIKGRLQCVQKPDSDSPQVELVAETVTFPVTFETR